MRTASSSWIINCCSINFVIIILLSAAFYSLITPTFAQPPSYPPSTANLSTSWIINYNADSRFIFDSNPDFKGIFNPILLTEETMVTRFALSFFCQLGENVKCNSKNLFAIFIVDEDYNSYPRNPPPLVWSANRDHPVNNNATLNFTAAGELVLRDANGTMVWSTNTAGKSVIGMNLTDAGNLVLYDVNHQVVWQSFDHPTDCLVPGQPLFQGQKLISSVSATNTQKGMYSLQVTDEGLYAYIELNPPQPYFLYYTFLEQRSNEGKRYVSFLNGSLSLFTHSAKPSEPDLVISIPPASSAQYMKLMPDGHLKVFEWQSHDWKPVSDDLLTTPLGECGYPLACGRNTLCSNKQQCSCPASSSPGIEYFRAVHDREPNLGCSLVTPLTCNATQHHDFIPVENVSYFTFAANLTNVNATECKQACLKNCSCKAAIFRNISADCYLPSDLFTMATITDSYPPFHDYNITVFIKVQNASAPSFSTFPNPTVLQKRKNRVAKVLGPAIGIPLIVVVGFVVFIVHKKRQYSETEEEEEYFHQVGGITTRFSYGELKTATENFSKKLGEGGFGTVFEGILEDGSKIAVKCLVDHGQVNKSFLAEIESIGSIHHVNLVRLRGYSAWKSQRLLVYDFMSNGSLDHWIYHGDMRGHVLEWECRKNIILDIAKGLAYLHEECRQQIIHLDIKPQNILLDDNFNAKVSDFGLSKLVDKNQTTQVMTTLKGTPGYIAPECWSNLTITEKVDVYSFGIVVLEILCGRKIFDRSLSEESWHLLGVFQKCWEQRTLLDMVDKYGEDMQANGAEVVEMMKIASWCLQTEFTRRPSMSSVVKVLEGAMSVELNLDYNFTDFLRMQKIAIAEEEELTRLMPSLLSGPR
uniref:G-type lectin S-receptor-like serine/threonine-protein kinase SD2-5 n=1 Tax=Erigeron canadensis TaxID=72917 RepID=UPI001CB8DA9F|nr:G-type lectin S-receptor-like serine/threonine-protein kinase SD2-5 [Erigeron canadensis]